MKLLIHAINGVGLGHLVRTLEIARAVLAQTPDTQIVFVTNSAFPDLLNREGFRVYTLKYHTGMVLDGAMPYAAYLEANYLRLRAVIQKERPDVILMDSEFNGPLVDFCSQNQIRSCFVLRDTTDQRVNDLCQGGLDKTDLVLVPHREEELPAGRRALLVQQGNVHFIGPILRAVGERRKGTKDDGIVRILVTFSAGADIPGNRDLYLKVSDFLRKLRQEKMSIGGKKALVSIVTGPFFTDKVCHLQGFDYKKFEDDLPEMMMGSDIAIAPAGYNICNELICTKTPALLMPVRTQEDDQYARARRLEEKGCIFIVQTGVWELLERLIVENKVPGMRSAFPEIIPGNAAVAQRIMELV